MAMDAVAFVTHSALRVHLFVCRDQKPKIQLTYCIDLDRSSCLLTCTSLPVQYPVVARIKFFDCLSGTT
jgi:hypothetical protein